MAIKRKANASAKLITAPTGPAAPLMNVQAPTPTGRRTQAVNTSLPAPVEVTGSPKKQNINTSVGEQVNQGLVKMTKNNRSGRVTASVGGNNYSQETVDAIVKRGDSGASLNPSQRAVYEQYLHDVRGVKTAKETATDEQIAKEQRENAFKVAQAEAKRKADAEAAEAKNKFTVEQMELNRQNKLDVQAAKDKAAADKAAREQAIKDEAEEQWNGRYGVDTGTRLSKNEKDLIEKGYKAWGYSKADQDVIDQYDATIERAKASGEYSDEEIAALESQRAEKLSGMKKSVVDNPNAPTAEQAYGRTFVDPKTGIRWATDKDGKLTEINTTPKETPEQKAAADKSKWIRDQIVKMDKPIGENGNEREWTAEELNAHAERFGKMYDLGSGTKIETPKSSPSGGPSFALPLAMGGIDPNKPVTQQIPQPPTSTASAAVKPLPGLEDFDQFKRKH